MALLRCEGTYDGYEDCEDDYDSWSDDQERLERERRLDDRADEIYNQYIRDSITENQARSAWVRAVRPGFTMSGE